MLSSVHAAHLESVLHPQDVHVLLVDDEQLSRLVVGNLLRKCDYKGEEGCARRPKAGHATLPAEAVRPHLWLVSEGKQTVTVVVCSTAVDVWRWCLCSAAAGVVEKRLQAEVSVFSVIMVICLP